MKDFLTYEQYNSTKIDTLDLNKGFNLIVGKNGSGKSSYLKAISYVLTDQYNGLSKQQKRGFFNNIAS